MSESEKEQAAVNRLFVESGEKERQERGFFFSFYAKKKKGQHIK